MITGKANQDKLEMLGLLPQRGGRAKVADDLPHVQLSVATEQGEPASVGISGNQKCEYRTLKKLQNFFYLRFVGSEMQR